MEKSISFTERDLLKTISRMDHLFDNIQTHHLPLIYEVLSKKEATKGNLDFGLDIFKDMIFYLDKIISQLDEFDGARRKSINVEKELNRILEYRKIDIY